MEKTLQVLLFIALMLIAFSALLAIRAHYHVWRYSPAMERLPRPAPPQPPTE